MRKKVWNKGTKILPILFAKSFFENSPTVVVFHALSPDFICIS